MKSLFKYLLLFAVSSTSLAAESVPTCDPCDPCETSLTYSVYADYLYWQVKRSDMDFSSESGRKYLCPDYDHNFRVGAELHCQNLDFGVRYTNIDGNYSESDDKFHIDFGMVDIETGYNIELCSINAVFKPLAGVKIVWSNQKWRTEFDDDLKGVGLYLGAESKWFVCNKQFCDKSLPISLLFRGSMGILEGSNDYRGTTGKECLYTFTNDVFFGLNSQFCNMQCGNADIEIGYEMQNYTNWAHFFGFSGLVVRLALNF